MLYDFGPRLLKLRKGKNLTQQMVVERAKGFDPNLRLSDSVLGKYEGDLAVPRLTEAAALADVLNVSFPWKPLLIFFFWRYTTNSENKKYLAVSFLKVRL